jgi:hypothetical protein
MNARYMELGFVTMTQPRIGNDPILTKGHLKTHGLAGCGDTHL